MRIASRVEKGALASYKTYTAETYFNGLADASGIGEDVKEYDDAIVVLNVGTVASNGTINGYLVESDDNTALASTFTKIAGSDFDEVDADSDESSQIISVDIKKHKRYIAVKTVIAEQSVSMGVDIYLSGTKFPVLNTIVASV